MAYRSGTCWCCHKRRPVESHHLTPLNYGGEKDGPQVDICADCHNVLHKEAEYYAKHGKFQELDFTIPYQENAYGERIRQLIAYVVKSKAAFKAGEFNAGQQRRMIQISFDSDQELRMAHAVKEQMKFKSLERAIKKLIFDKYLEMLK